MLAQILPQIYPLTEYYVVLANGEFPRHQFLTQLLRDASGIICCDGAVNKLLRHNILPNYIIGDCDSINSTVKAKFADKIIFRPDQSTNDLTKALEFAQKILKAEHIIILGATGLREDHTLGNIAILAEFTPCFSSSALISDHGIFTTHTGNSVLKTIVGQQISFFTLDPYNTLNCQELKWPLTNFQIKTWNSGTLNQAITNIVKLSCTHPTIIYRTFEIKPINSNAI